MGCIVFNKPFRVLCQFSPSAEKTTLAAFGLPAGYYPAGRLDYDSEGLLLLTDDGALQARISHPRHRLGKIYWAQVEGALTDTDLTPLRRGISLPDGPCQPAAACCIKEPELWPRTPPIRDRKAIPTSWMQLTLREGRNRQVRRMTAAIGFPTLRLVRSAVGPVRLDGLAPGHWRTIDTPT